MGRQLGLFERQQLRALVFVVLPFFDVVFAPVFRPAALIDSATNARNGSSMGSRFFLRGG